MIVIIIQFRSDALLPFWILGYRVVPWYIILLYLRDNSNYMQYMYATLQLYSVHYVLSIRFTSGRCFLQQHEQSTAFGFYNCRFLQLVRQYLNPTKYLRIVLPQDLGFQKIILSSQQQYQYNITPPPVHQTLLILKNWFSWLAAWLAAWLRMLSNQ